MLKRGLSSILAMMIPDGLTTETIQGQVVSKANNYQVGGSSGKPQHIIKSPQLRLYERRFREQCTIYKGRNIDRHFTLFVNVYESSTRYDLDNALKTILDCLQQVNAIKNDNLCMKIVAEKHLDERNPRIVFAIQEHEPRLFG